VESPREDFDLVEAPALRLLFLDVVPNRRLIAAHGRDVVSPGLIVLPGEVLAPPDVTARNVDRTLPLDEPEDLRHRVLRGMDNSMWTWATCRWPFSTTHSRCRASSRTTGRGVGGAPRLVPCAGLWDSHNSVLALPPSVG
jgi:hypothetical protein